MTGRIAYRAAVGIALLASFLTFWSTLVRDDGNGIGSLMLVVAAAVAAFSAGFEAAGLARAMLGIAIMQVLLAIAMATAPSIASLPRGSMKAMASGGFLALLWLVSAALFRVAARKVRGG